MTRAEMLRLARASWASKAPRPVTGLGRQRLLARVQVAVLDSVHRDSHGRFASGGGSEGGSGGGSTWDTRAERTAHVARTAATPVVETKGHGGFMGGTARETHEGGTVLIHKQPADDRESRATTGVRQADAEELGSHVSAALGLAAPAVYRAGPTDLHMEHVVGTHIEHMSITPWKQPPQDVIDSHHGRMMGMLDILIGNPDRHAGNWLQTPGGGLAPLDNALAFGRHGSSGLSSPFTAHFVNKAGNDWASSIDISPHDMATVRSRLESLHGEFARLGRQDWHQTMMSNLSILESRASGTTHRLTP